MEPKFNADVIAGIIRGNTVDTLGAPVDIINIAVKALAPAIASDKPIGGSAWLREIFGQPSEPRNIDELLGTLISVGGATKAVMLPAILKQHGTSKFFDKFAKQFFFTGEGNQAFGEGIYTSDKLGKHYAEVAYNANVGKHANIAEISALEWKLQERYAPGKPPMAPEEVAATIKELNLLKKKAADALKDTKKVVMQVELPAGEWLNWDAKNPDVVVKIPNLKQFGVTVDDTGKQIYNKIRAKSPDKSTSEILDSFGIRGHFYLDAGSRAKGTGTANQVTYNPDRLKIISSEEIK